jgi:hypothetical protein
MSTVTISGGATEEEVAAVLFALAHAAAEPPRPRQRRVPRRAPAHRSPAGWDAERRHHPTT